MTYTEILMALYWDSLYHSVKGHQNNNRPREAVMKHVVFGGTRQPFNTDNGHPTTAKIADFMWVFDREFLLDRFKIHTPKAVLFEMDFPKTKTAGVSDVIPFYTELGLIGIPFFVTTGTQMVEGGGGSSQPMKIIFLSEADMVLGAAALAGM